MRNIPKERYVPFSTFLETLRGRGFLTASEVLDRYEAMEKDYVISGGPMSAGQDLVGGTTQGMLKSLGAIMRAHGVPPTRTTGGKRGYRL